jgi:four helix bundle protein
MSRSLRLEELEVYKVAMEIGEIVWNIVIRWEYFEKKTLGVQLVDAADSIAFNISEGYGRFHFKENKNFCYYSRGSAKETITGIRKAKTRNLVSDEEFIMINEKLDIYFRLMFGYINSIGQETIENSYD